MYWTHFTIEPNSGETGDEAAQLRARLSHFGVGDTDFQLREYGALPVNVRRFRVHERFSSYVSFSGRRGDAGCRRRITLRKRRSRQ